MKNWLDLGQVEHRTSSFCTDYAYHGSPNHESLDLGLPLDTSITVHAARQSADPSLHQSRATLAAEAQC